VWQPDASSLALGLSHRFGLNFTGTSGRDSEGHYWIAIQPVEVDSRVAFRIQITLGWRNLHVAFVPSAFAGDLIREMGQAAQQSSDTFVQLAQRAVDGGAVITMNVNRNKADPLDATSWPANWERLDLVLHKAPLAVNTEDSDENNNQLESWSRRFTGMVLALMPLELVEEDVPHNPEGLPEGACFRVEVNRYERSRVNRANCVEIHGESCKACGFNFGHAYGRLGSGYIHVHHIVPVSELGPHYAIDPARDLVPLCPNCHAMVHHQKPPLTVQELKKLLVLRDGRPGTTPMTRFPD
jgi:5-methylcytosine-specific restriction enzyme A